MRGAPGVCGWFGPPSLNDVSAVVNDPESVARRSTRWLNAGRGTVTVGFAESVTARVTVPPETGAKSGLIADGGFAEVPGDVPLWRSVGAAASRQAAIRLSALATKATSQE